MALLNWESQLRLDTEYSLEKLSILESALDRGYLCVGGQKATKELLDPLNLAEDDFVLDVGSGLGGPALFIAKEYKSRVLGLDLCHSMISKANSYLAMETQDIKSKINFKLADITLKDFLPLSFDYIFCRETLFHCDNKGILLSKFFHWLKPGGKLVLSEYCAESKSSICGDEDEDIYTISDISTNPNHHFISFKQTVQLLKRIGFQIVESKDKTLDVIANFKEDLFKLQFQTKSKVLKQNKNIKLNSVYDTIIQEWRQQIGSLLDGNQKLGYFIARKQ